MAKQTTKYVAEVTEREVKINDKNVVVYATEKAKQMKAGKAYEVNSIVAEKLIKQGKATKENPKAEKEASK